MVTSWKLIFRLAYDFLLYGTPGRKMAFQAVTDIRSEHVVTSLSSIWDSVLEARGLVRRRKKMSDRKRDDSYWHLASGIWHLASGIRHHRVI